MPGSLITDRGALWYAVSETRSRPGSGANNGFVLAVKSGAFSQGRDT